jgi:sulfur carrier protein
VIRVNGEDHDIVDETVSALLERLSIESRGIAVAVDGEVVRRSEWSTTSLHDGASVEIVTAAAGG